MVTTATQGGTSDKTPPVDFLRSYFIQTRQEIDTEKRERDQILHLIILVFGAFGFAIISDKAQDFLKSPASLFLDAGIAVLVTALFWLRRVKMQQIADRWYVLYSLVTEGRLGIPTHLSLEASVLPGLRGSRYSRKDFILFLAVCVPIYIQAGVSACLAKYDWDWTRAIVLTVVVVIFMVHFLVGARLFMPGFAAPQAATSPDEKTSVALADGSGVVSEPAVPTQSPPATTT